jgi:hypothetical protein
MEIQLGAILPPFMATVLTGKQAKEGETSIRDFTNQSKLPIVPDIAIHKGAQTVILGN